MNPTYHTTTPLPQDAYANAVRTAKRQDEAVLEIFAKSPHRLLTPSEVCFAGIAAGRKWLLTSVRRSITNLTDAGKLQRCSTTVSGPHGRPEHLWLLPRN